jgi:hypothetical protein
MKKIFLLLILISIFRGGYSQFVEKGTFKIFRGAVAGADINFRLESDNSYEIYVTNFWCSLCDFNQMDKAIHQKGHWSILNDSIKLMPEDTATIWYFKRINDYTLKPLFLLNRDFYNIKSDSLRNRMLDANIYTDLFDFKLLYETYNNGVVKNAKYKTGNNKTEYLITFDKSGQVNRIEKYKNGKKTRKELK